MMESILTLYKAALHAIDVGVTVSSMLETGIFEKVIKIKYDIPNDKLEMFDDMNKEISDTIEKLIEKL